MRTRSPIRILSHSYDIRIRSSASLSSFMEKQLDELKAKMEKSSLALAQFEKDLDVINPEEKTNILSARLLQLNTEYTKAQADESTKKPPGMDEVRIAGSGAGLPQGERSPSSTNAEPGAPAVCPGQSTYGSTPPGIPQGGLGSWPKWRSSLSGCAAISPSRIEVEYREALNREQMLQKAVADTKAEWDRYQLPLV